ncbi:MAG: DUF559 domain-containing protein [Chloroflexi bacterium]|nr:DUF559 domain-containing protein [Chloroflexota bacterium]
MTGSFTSETPPSAALARARQLRRVSTDAERRLWSILRSRQVGGHKFRRQQPIGPFIVDFVCPEQRVIIEADGDGHAWQVQQDRRRDEWLANRGYRVLRFSNLQLLKEADGVVAAILGALDQPR